MSDARKRRLRDRASGPATLISEGCRINGTIGGDGDFVVSGTVDGDCDVGGTVTLARGGHWQGTIRAADVIIAGSIDGDVVATGCVEIADSARVAGTITGAAIAVAEGAVVEGAMRTTVKEEPMPFVEKRAAAD